MPVGSYIISLVEKWNFWVLGLPPENLCFILGRRYEAHLHPSSLVYVNNKNICEIMYFCGTLFGVYEVLGGLSCNKTVTSYQNHISAIHLVQNFAMQTKIRKFTHISQLLSAEHP